MKSMIELAGYELVTTTEPNTITYYHVNFKGDSKPVAMERLSVLEYVAESNVDGADGKLQEEGQQSIGVRKA